MARRLIGLGLALTLTGFGLGACGRADVDAANTDSQVLTVYSSLPLQGPRAAESEAAANGQRLALREAGGRVRELTVKLAVLDDATPAREGWDPEQAAENARAAVRDRTAIAYLGDSDPGAPAVSLPILNEAGIAQVSPLSTYAGLTRTDGADKGEPDRFYPAQERTFARVVPADHVQARAQLDLMGREGCARLALLDDRDVYGRGLATTVERDAEAAGRPVLTGRASLRDDADPRGIAEDVVGSTPDCVFYGGMRSPEASALLEALHAADPQLELFVPNAFATPEAVAGLSVGAQARLHVTLPAPRPARLDAAYADFAAAYERAFGRAPLPASAYGYEAMKLVLRAIADAGSGGNNRTAVHEALLAVRDRDSILGRYSLDRFGDTTIDRYAQATVRDGRVRVVREVRATPGRPPATP